MPIEIRNGTVEHSADHRHGPRAQPAGQGGHVAAQEPQAVRRRRGRIQLRVGQALPHGGGHLRFQVSHIHPRGLPYMTSADFFTLSPPLPRIEIS